MARADRVKVKINLRNGASLEAVVGLPAGQSLATYLARSSGWLNLTSVVWDETGRMAEHLALQVDQVLWATAAEAPDEERERTRGTPRRKVKVHLDTGASPTGELALTDDQRLSDYLASISAFIPFFAPRELTGQSGPREVAMNRSAIVAVQELPEQPG